MFGSDHATSVDGCQAMLLTCVSKEGEVAMLYRTGLALGALIAAPSLAAAPAGLAGRWKTDDGKGIVSMAPCGGRMCGRIERLLIEEPPGGQRDVRNPDARSEEHTSELPSLMRISY